GLKGNDSFLTGEKYGITYYVFSHVQKSKPFDLFKNLRSIYGILKEEKKSGGKNILITEHSYFPLFLIYVLMAKRLNYKLIVTLTEWHLYFKKIPIIKRFDFLLFDYLFGYFTDAILPISTLLEQKVRHFRKPMLKVPILADFACMPAKRSITEEKYFLYCGHLGYYEVIEFIIKSFILFDNTNPGVLLRLVVSGQDSLLPRVLDLIVSQNLQGKVIIERRLPFDQLVQAYTDALALLIPLRPENQDRARFSHKIGEYLASGRPVITGAVGEIVHYFTHNKNAFIAVEYSRRAYADLMIAVAADASNARKVGMEGQRLGVKEFNYSTYGAKISGFLNTI
ncbi:MAG: glycosyltransferase family 4 protein, partial [Chitinophagaceae bacterium]|nr:glycosyltransferase family 4 protein [Chitinophagaceae bacterium]